VADHHLPVRLPAGVQHPPGLFHGQRQRLLAEDVQAPLQRLEDVLGVQGSRQADVDGVARESLEQLVAGGAGFGADASRDVPGVVLPGIRHGGDPERPGRFS
jgi:hypothetical protein